MSLINNSLLQRVLVFLPFFLLMLAAGTSHAGQKQILVLPFEINAPEELEYLQTGLPSMLTSSLRDKGLDVVEPELGQTLITREEVSYLDVEKARRLALLGDGRFALYGTFNAVDEYISLDARLVDGYGERETVPFYIVKEGVINILPAVEELAEKVYQEMLREERIASIDIEGVDILDPDVVLLRLQVQEGDMYDPEKLNRELRNIFDLGYFDDVQFHVEDTPQGKEVTIVVEEKPLIQNINISGADDISESDVREVLTTRTGSVVNPQIISEDLGRIRELYRGKGYYNATVDYSISEIDEREANLNINIDEGNRLFIRGIEIRGAEEISERTLRGEMELKRRGIFSWLTGRGVLREELLDRDVAALEAFYADKGYIDARVGQPDVDYEEDGIYLTFHVEEGHRYKMGEVSFQGDLLVSEDELKKLTILDDLGEEGEYFSRSSMQKDTQNLADFYTDYGYAFAEADVNMLVDEDEKKVDVIYNLSKGEKIYIGRVLIEGNTRTRDNVIRREMRLTDGDLFRGSDLRRSTERLQRLDYFEQVDIQPVPTEDDNVLDLVTQVEEKPTGMLSAGAGYSSYDRVFFTGMIQQRNLFGKGYQLSFSGSFGARTTRFDLDFWNPRVRDSNLGMGADLYWIDEEYFTYDRDTRGGRAKFAYTIGEYTRLHWNYRLENYEITNVDDDAHRDIKDLEGENWSSGAYVAAIRDTRNRRINPSRGTRNLLSVEYAGGLLQGDDNFIKYIASSDYYRPVLNRSIFHWKGQAGYVMRNTDEDIPNFELFRLGGINSVRGYAARKLAPRFDDGEVKGGDKHFFTNFELLHPLNEEIGLMGLVFFDAGNVWDKGESVDFDLYKSIGAGVRWYSPMGPIRVEYGYALDDLEDSSRSQIEFSMGHEF
ncbi:outer membrane protein assembly factor BamA [Desulfonatronospira sp. MSAO_Bac3]|uniref:outer membrane protein assembly factor BamA n=1 Tax=Desulfonatronospira sp. MSAO_Bac3 TaxID=2293857 RepID=UPI000FF65F1A|nr:outer membrane protein assembly factor BamA [Desulfonatronospira sp. MSAO_Bac3]RQD76418.1 MAG: outer membrane protein assembly factor BamA [Desulfonatronospira sp. MSAO_Bac3]